MMMDEIQYHTPLQGLFSHYKTPPEASTDETQGENRITPTPTKVHPMRRPTRPHTKRCTAAEHRPSTQHPNAHNLCNERSSTIPHTHCSGCVVISATEDHTHGPSPEHCNPHDNGQSTVPHLLWWVGSYQTVPTQKPAQQEHEEALKNMNAQLPKTRARAMRTKPETHMSTKTCTSLGSWTCMNIRPSPP
ncbi:hypothetical protein BS47DRAFT_1359822 [Hydnum rufescens UP504]|uniref:Uncharacterized protein n=1 Tax=Hydnum rufescens UP504 TaxID=1448309 RepID=A0A9P6DX37_9AGAM|nr:hypothetical protein BS47DRAFT_1359822 [Hydnum rufescens UP504]